ncbi:N4-gp56 family major capsid protein [Streptomyces sp. KhCrAH-43]|uniref:phage major capsid protein n=1 Tax=unclassified Streptomyces TaxID=2593676 RepID=UPI0003811219|nr:MULTISPECIES: P22 phage major capsid protein family protein [unclassified Streptomyces]MYS34926.1 P22 coat protein - protein 5 domain protein [Streptomyces sp. SID4920]MYX65297.1 P22 coat protein - protein 5 domain protein [Streptomyces sp. SID8373]RAJ64730.1 N4-gp56 family major capsid protein [Streptomyces sp. KhCrAH-43]
MTVRNFVPEIWSSRLLVAVRKALIYAGPTVVNRDYEGEISEAGDTVRITSVSRPAVGNYVPGSTVITPEKLTTGQRTLVVDQSKYWAFSIDDVDARQAKGGLVPQAMSEAAYALADTVDQYVAGLYTQIQTANFVNQSGSPIDTYTTPTDAYDKVLVPLRTKLTKANVPTAGRYAIVSAEFYASLLLDSRFIKVNESGTSDGLRNGMVGRAAGFDIYESNNIPVPSGDTQVVTAGTNAAITFAEQINKTEAYRPESSFSDAVKGLALYGAKMVRPDHLAAAFINPTAA